MGWTDEQKTAIEYSDGSAIVSAAAGSGKTAVLVERVKRIIMDKEKPVNADEIVLVTFTQKAAEELKVRLERALIKAEEENENDEYLRKQRIRLEDARISTISAFCMRILREYGSSADLFDGEEGEGLTLSHDFGVLDESESAVMINNALSDVLEDFYKNGDENKKAVLYDWYGDEKDAALEKSVKYVYDFMKKLPDAEGSIKKWLEMYKNPDKHFDALKKEMYEKTILPKVKELKEIVEKLGDYDGDKEGYNKDGNAYAKGAKAIIKELWENLGSPDVLDDYEEPYNAVLKIEELSLGRSVPRNEKGAEIKNARDVMNENLPEIKEKCFFTLNLKEHFSNIYPVLSALVELARKTDEEYSMRKRLKNKIDFSDAELLVIKLLRDDETAKNIKKNIALIIVDEFQDSNDIQYEIFLRLSDNKKNLFFVGDIKQSIYRFRGANPRVFNRVSKDSEFFKLITLNKNFRSSDKVIDTVNKIFEGTMTEEVGEVEYNEETMLYQGKPYESDDSYKTELIRFSGGNVKLIRRAEADYIARRINEMVESGFMVTDNGEKRPCTYGDFAILMGRYKTNAFIYKKALDAAGVPYIAREDGAFTDYYEVKLILSLLRVIDNPYKNLDMAAVLTLPPYNFTPDELCELKLSGKAEGEKPHQSLYSGLKTYAEKNEKAKKFYNELKELREFSSEHSPEQLMRKIYDESDMVSAILAMFDGDKRDSNIKRLISYARKYSENGVKGLCDFIAYMDNLKRTNINVAQGENAALAENSVQIMTVHGSKGLEFPICIIANLDTSDTSGCTTSLTDSTNKVKLSHAGKIVADIDEGIGLQVVDKNNRIISGSYTYSNVEKSIINQETSERMRLLYVALTRAKEKLIITAPVKNIKNIGGHLKWIMDSKAVILKESDKKKKDEDDIESTDESEIVVRRVIDCTDYKPFKPAAREEMEEEGVEIKLSGEYRYSALSGFRAKVTATQIGVKSVDDFAETRERGDRFFKTPSFIKAEKTALLSGKKRGDAYHKVMELLDFSKSEDILDELYNDGKLTEAEWKCVRKEDIKGFLESDLCKRINKSPRVEKEFPIFCQYTPENFPEDEEKPFIQGIADLFFVEDGEIVLVDYKTNRNITEEELKEEYVGQLKIYSAALEKVTKKRVKECYLYSFDKNKAILVDF